MIDIDKYEGHTPADEWRLVFKEVNPLYSNEHPHNNKQMLGLRVKAYHLGQMQACDYEDYLVAQANQDLARDTPLLLAEVKRLRESLYKCWKDSGQSLHYLQVELLNDQEYWYEQMICDDDSKRCGDYGIEDCECDEE